MTTIGETERLILILAAGGFLLGCAWAFLLGKGISRPMTAMCNAMRKLAAGNFEVVLPGLGRKDELGEMASAVEEFKVQAIARAERDAATQEAQNKAASAARRAELIRFADEFETAVGAIVANVSSSAVQLEAAAGTLTRTAETTQSLSSQVAGASEEASTNMQSVASATEELSASVDEIGRRVKESSQIAEAAVRQAEQTDGRIGKLSRAAQEIGDVVKLITAIAEQTNLLALNATIEAARAGDAGRGFAVVASEVKSLASQTAKATDEISNHISGMQGATQELVAAIKEIGGTIGKISDIASTIASAVEQQSSATQEIARSVQNVAQGTQEAAANVMHVNRGATETGVGIRGSAEFRAHAVERKHAPARRARSLHGEYQGGVISSALVALKCHLIHCCRRPARPGDPVFQRRECLPEKLRRTGCPAFAGNDDRFDGSKRTSSTISHRRSLISPDSLTPSDQCDRRSVCGGTVEHAAQCNQFPS